MCRVTASRKDLRWSSGLTTLPGRSLEGFPGRLLDHPLDCNGTAEQWPLFVRAGYLYMCVRKDHRLYTCHTCNWPGMGLAVASSFCVRPTDQDPKEAHLVAETTETRCELDAPGKGYPPPPARPETTGALAEDSRRRLPSPAKRLRSGACGSCDRRTGRPSHCGEETT